MKVAYVVPRYGVEVVGGAELGARMLAERLTAMLGWDVEVFTTCALDARTWADEYAPATVDVNGVTVHRFASRAGRHPDFDRLSGPVLADPAGAPVEEQEAWIERQGPVCPDVVDAVAASDAERCIFYPYLYYPTVRGIGKVAERAVMHPAAHDEAPLRLPLFRDVFAAAHGLVFQTDGERRLVERLFPVAQRAQIVLGLGVEEHAGDEVAFRAGAGLGDRPYLVCLGRVDDGKGARLLAEFFAAYKRRRPGPLALAFVGPVVHRPPAHPDIMVTGPVDEAAKWGALRGARAFVSPSPYEAFSIVLMEAWTAGVPALVHGRCLATREHAQRSGGGLWFESYAQFEAAVDRLDSDGTVRAALAARGRAYVDANFTWPVLIDRYRTFLERLT